MGLGKLFSLEGELIIRGSDHCLCLSIQINKDELLHEFDDNLFGRFLYSHFISAHFLNQLHAIFPFLSDVFDT
jgi:hypothetical protein